MRKRIGAALAAASAIWGTAPAQAEELWNAYPLRGFGEGLSVATPPKGVYGILSTYYASDDLYDGNGDKVANTNTDVALAIPIVLVVPGWKVLGADYSIVAGLPLIYTRSPTIAGVRGGKGNVGIFNAIVSPINLTWKAKDVYVRAGVTVYLPTATETIRSLRSGRIRNGGLPSGSNFTTIQPDLGVSYLKNGWNATVDTHYADPITTSTDGPNYRFHSGAELAIDATLTKTVGKWTLGMGAHQTWQVQEDRLNGRRIAGSKGHILGLGPIVGYQLGKVTVQAIWNKSVAIENNVSGNFFHVRLIKAL